MTTLNLPYVKREESIFTNCRMLTTITTIIIVVMFLIYMFYDEVQIETMMSESENNTYVKIPRQVYYVTRPETGRYVTISNMSRKILPVKNIIVIDAAGKMQQFMRKRATTRILGEHGVAIEFMLPKSIDIAQIVIEVDVFCKHQKKYAYSKCVNTR